MELLLSEGVDSVAETHALSARPYVCSKCGASGVKLWREYNTLADLTDLYCRSCAEADQDRKLGVGCDQIGWLVPAVPTNDGDGSFWGYTSDPPEGVTWWHSLPPNIR